MQDVFARRSRRCRKGARRGTATVEFAVVAMPLLIFLLGAIDVGQYINVSQAVTNAAREGARRAAEHATTSEADVQDTVLDYLEECFPRAGRGTIDAATTVNVTSLAAAATGQPIEVTVTFGFDTVRWLHGPGFAAGREFVSSTVMRRE